MMTTEETAWDSLSYAGKNHILFERQKHLLEEFLVRNAISREQYEKKTMNEGVSASFLNEWNGSRNHREKIYFDMQTKEPFVFLCLLGPLMEEGSKICKEG